MQYAMSSEVRLRCMHLHTDQRTGPAVMTIINVTPDHGSNNTDPIRPPDLSSEMAMSCGVSPSDVAADVL